MPWNAAPLSARRKLVGALWNDTYKLFQKKCHYFYSYGHNRLTRLSHLKFGNVTYVAPFIEAKTRHLGAKYTESYATM